jgi:hypothetical protein
MNGVSYRVTTPGPRGYRRATGQPVSPEVLDLITAWVQGHWGQT